MVKLFLILSFLLFSCNGNIFKNTNKKNNNLFYAGLLAMFNSSETKEESTSIEEELILSTAEICYTNTSSTLTPNVSTINNYYGLGKNLYLTSKIKLSLGSIHPTGIPYVVQNHSYSTERPIVFRWYDKDSSVFTNRDPSNGITRIGQHSYASDTGDYTSNQNKYDSKNEINYSFDIGVPDQSKNVTLDLIIGCNGRLEEEMNFKESITNDSKSGLSTKWTVTKKININLIFIDGAYTNQSLDGLKKTTETLKSLFLQKTVNVLPSFTTKVYSNSEFLTIVDLIGEDATVTSSLSKLYSVSSDIQDQNSVNVYLTKNETEYGGVLGVAGGLPGTPVKGTIASGVTLFIDAFRSSSKEGEVLTDTEQILLADTITHEVGHFLGLFHATESSGYDASASNAIYKRDAIKDTPYCDKINDADGNGSLSAGECSGTSFSNSGSLNIMFWAMSGETQKELTGGQGFVIRSSPLVH